MTSVSIRPADAGGDRGMAGPRRAGLGLRLRLAALGWPELPGAAAEPALLRGYHRSFCLYSYDYRGTPKFPGLTLGLDRGGSCRGAVLRLPADALDRVWQREMSGRLVYAARLLPVRTANGKRPALAFTALRGCPDYAGRLPLDEAARLILGAAGRRGTCREYFENTLRHLEQLGLADRPLRRLADAGPGIGRA